MRSAAEAIRSASRGLTRCSRRVCAVRTRCGVAATLLLTATACTGDGRVTSRSSPTAPRVPSAAAAPTEGSRAVSVYLSDGGCRAATPTARTVPQSGDIAEAALAELLRGPTDDEARRGLAFFGSRDEPLLRGLRITDGTAYVDLTEAFLRLTNVSTSCGGEIFRTGVENTLRRYGVSEVRFAVAGTPARYYEHMQLACPSPATSGDRCDPASFAH